MIPWIVMAPSIIAMIELEGDAEGEQRDEGGLRAALLAASGRRHRRSRHGRTFRRF